jgi:hypothetical protein
VSSGRQGRPRSRGEGGGGPVLSGLGRISAGLWRLSGRGCDRVGVRFGISTLREAWRFRHGRSEVEGAVVRLAVRAWVEEDRLWNVVGAHHAGD